MARSSRAAPPFAHPRCRVLRHPAPRREAIAQTGDRSVGMDAPAPSPRQLRLRNLATDFAGCQHIRETHHMAAMKRLHHAVCASVWIACQPTLHRNNALKTCRSGAKSDARRQPPPRPIPMRGASKRPLKTCRFPIVPLRSSATGSRVDQTPVRYPPRQWSGSTPTFGECRPPECRPCRSLARSKSP